MPTINIKLSNGNTVSAQVADLTSGTVADLKKAIAPACDIPAGEQRVVFKGRILKDGDALADAKIEDGVSIHVVRSGAGAATTTTAAPAHTAPAATAPAHPTTAGPHGQPAQQQQQQQPANPFASLFGGMPAGAPPQQQQPQGGFGGAGFGGFGGMPAGGFGGMMGNPQAQAMMQQMQNNPQARQQMQATLQLLAQNPAMMRQILSMDPTIQAMPPADRENLIALLSNPLMVQAMLGGMMGGGGGGFGGMGGFGAPAGGQQPPQQGGAPGAGGLDMAALQQAMGALGGGGGAGGGAGFGGGLGAFGHAPAGGGGGALMPDQARVLYRDQLAQLQQMGFPNEEANVRALIQAQGDVNFAIARLLGE